MLLLHSHKNHMATVSVWFEQSRFELQPKPELGHKFVSVQNMNIKSQQFTDV